MSRTNDSSDNLGPWHWGGRGNVGVSAPRVHGVPAVCPIQDAMDGLSSGYHVHSSLQRLAPHVSMRSLKGTTGIPVKLAREKQALGVRGQRPRSGPHKRRNTTVASPAQLSGVATGRKLVIHLCLLLL
jgi:hypothetical protein